MSDQPTAPDETTPPADEPSAPSRARLRDRVFGLRGMLAVGVAGLVLGAAAGTAIGFAADSDGPDQRPGRFGSPFPGGTRGHEPDGFRPPSLQSPPSTAPDEEVQPDGSSGTNS